MERRPGYYWVKDEKGGKFKPLYFDGSVWQYENSCDNSDTPPLLDFGLTEINETRIPSPDEPPTVTRFEVIDNTLEFNNRCLVKTDVQVDLKYQDDGRTLKVFVYKGANSPEASDLREVYKAAFPLVKRGDLGKGRS